MLRLSQPAEYDDQVLNVRQASHGDYPTAATIAQELKAAMRRARTWPCLPAFMRESLDLIATKIARILAGDPTIIDHWDDIAGYARLAVHWIKAHNPER